MKFIVFFVAQLSVSFSFAALKPISLEEAQSLIENPTTAIQESLDAKPDRYEFFNLVGQPTVNYPGQVLRQTLLSKLKGQAGSYKRGQIQGSPETIITEINQIFRHSKEFELLPHGVGAKDDKDVSFLIFEGVDFGSVDDSGKSLLEKMAGEDNDLRQLTLKGWNQRDMEGVSLSMTQEGYLMPAALVDQFIEVIAQNASSGTTFKVPNGSLGDQEVEGAHILQSGVDLSQLMQKFVAGAMSFSQAVEDYLSVDLGPGKGLNADNLHLNPDTGNTTLEHHWDEAYGYFGAARNFSDYSDEQVRKGVSIDAFNSGFVYDKDGIDFLYVEQSYVLDKPSVKADKQISLHAEKNFGYAVNAGKRDVGSSSGQVDFTGEIFGALLKGRHLINDRPDGYLPYVQAYAMVVAYQWERLIAANTIHYINELQTDLKAYGSADFKFTEMAKHFGEMKGFALSFQFNPNSPLSERQFDDLHNWLQDQPADVTQDTTVYQGQLDMARNLLEKVYKFNHDDVVAW